MNDWGLLALSELGNDADSRVISLLRHGNRGIQALDGIATITSLVLSPERQAPLYLPFYGESDMGDGGWWDIQSKPLTVADMPSRFAANKGPHKEQIALLVAMGKSAPERLINAGPTLVAEDIGLDLAIVLDGSKRIVASHVLGIPRPAVVVRSKWAHVLYPAEFLAHIIRGRGSE